MTSIRYHIAGTTIDATLIVDKLSKKTKEYFDLQMVSKNHTRPFLDIVSA